MSKKAKFVTCAVLAMASFIAVAVSLIMYCENIVVGEVSDRKRARLEQAQVFYVCTGIAAGLGSIVFPVAAMGLRMRMKSESMD